MQKPYRFQDEARRALLSGSDLIIQGPTGVGKTRAALEPGLVGIRDHPADFPPRILYSVPMRVLANSFLDEYTRRAREKSWSPELHPNIQTGEQPDDPQLEGRVIFATVDQILASFLNLPYGLPRRLDNINAGALIGTYLIFDEFHLYPQDQMMLTVLAMLKMLKGISRFVLMSATFSPVFLQDIARVLDAQVIADKPGTPIPAGHFADVTRLGERQRTFYAEEGALTPQAVLDRIDVSQDRVLCICNTVDRAQALYRGLRGTPGVECRLLHSRFYRRDRRHHEQWVLERFKADDGEGKRPAILVATQVVEVGLDITSNVLLTECAPAASLIQRAGRCAREKGEGRVYVFQPYDDEGQVNYAPYLDEGKEEICHKTWETLTSAAFNGQVMGFPEEQRLVELAHGEADLAFMQGLEPRIDQRIEDITRCITERHPGWTATLIRQNDSVPLYIHARPADDDLLTSKSGRREALSLTKGQVARLMEQEPGEAEFTLMVGHELPPDEPDTPGATFTTYWTLIKEAGEVYSASNWQFVAHPLAVSYSPEMGLTLAPGDQAALPSPEVPERPWDRPAYRAERYQEHIAGLWWAYTRPITTLAWTGDGQRDHSRPPLRDELAYPLCRLCERMKRSPNTPERLMRLALALHDVGKLNMPWQTWARAWQSGYAHAGYDPTLPLDDPFPLAHTDWDANDQAQRELQWAFKHAPRGPHAVEGAEATVPVIVEAAGGDEVWAAVTLGAMMRHHTPDAIECGPFEMVAGGHRALALALRVCGFSGEEAAGWAAEVKPAFTRSGWDVDDAAKWITPSRNEYVPALLYLLLVRILRLADQRAGRYLERYAAEILPVLRTLESEVSR